MIKAVSRFVGAIVPVAFVVSVALTGCVADEAPEPNGDSTGSSTAERGKIGKADLWGSCQSKGSDYCGDRSNGSCWCDDYCDYFGDCCDDKADTCDAPPQDICGGIAGFMCDDGYVCVMDGCGAQYPDQSGTCVVQPEVCPKNYAPVCGCDGNTYGNSCQALAAGANVESDGACEPTATLCGGWLGDTCTADEYCDFPQNSCGWADQSGECTTRPEACLQVYNPVCGCNGQTYSNSCSAANAGTDVVHGGACAD